MRAKMWKRTLIDLWFGDNGYYFNVKIIFMDEDPGLYKATDYSLSNHYLFRESYKIFHCEVVESLRYSIVCSSF